MQVPKGQGQVSGGVSVPCRHATPVANVLWKPFKIRGYQCIWSGHRMPFNICEKETSYCLIRSPYRPKQTSSMTISSVPWRIPVREAYLKVASPSGFNIHSRSKPGISYKLRNKGTVGGRCWNIATQERKICDVKIKLHVCHKWKCEVDRPSRSTEVNPGKRQKYCSLSCLSSRVQRDTSGPGNSQTNSGLFMDKICFMKYAASFRFKSQ